MHHGGGHQGGGVSTHTINQNLLARYCFVLTDLLKKRLEFASELVPSNRNEGIDELPARDPDTSQLFDDIVAGCGVLGFRGERLPHLGKVRGHPIVKAEQMVKNGIPINRGEFDSLGDPHEEWAFNGEGLVQTGRPVGHGGGRSGRWCRFFFCLR